MSHAFVKHQRRGVLDTSTPTSNKSFLLSTMSYGEPLADPALQKQLLTGAYIPCINDFAAGCLGGCAGLVFGHPFDTVKVRQHTYTGPKITIAQCARQTLSNEGVYGFFKGLAFPLAAVGLLNSIFFGVYGLTLRVLSTGRRREEKGIPYYRDIFVAGAFAGAVQAIPACPIELVKVRLQVQKGMSASIPGIPIRYTGPVDCIRHIYRTHGVHGCFTGLNATVMREITGFSIYITSYELMCDRMTPEGAGECSVRTMLLAGGLSGMVSWMVNIPIDIIKSRLQVDDFARPKYSGTWDCARSSYRASGWRIFWRGLPVTCIRAFPVNAVTFAVYSTTLKALSEMTAEA